MSWYTVGEIIVWLLIAAVLGGALGWLLRGVLRPRIVEVERRTRRPVAAAPDAHAEPEPEPEPASEPQLPRTIVTDVDVPQAKPSPKQPMPTTRTPAHTTPRTPPTSPADARGVVCAEIGRAHV